MKENNDYYKNYLFRTVKKDFNDINVDITWKELIILIGIAIVVIIMVISLANIL